MFVATFIAILAGGCASSADSSAGQKVTATGVVPSATANAPELAVATATANNTASQEPIIEYRRIGGFIGLDDYLKIETNRKATVVRKKGASFETVLDQQRYEQVLQQLDEAKFTDLDKEYLPANLCCDLTEYLITYKGKTVRTMDTAVPSGLQPVLRTLNGIVERR